MARFGSSTEEDIVILILYWGIQEGWYTIKQILHAASYSISQLINPREGNINLGLRPRLISLPSGE